MDILTFRRGVASQPKSPGRRSTWPDALGIDMLSPRDAKDPECLVAGVPSADAALPPCACLHCAHRHEQHAHQLHLRILRNPPR